jgi:hypothetical protein
MKKQTKAVSALIVGLAVSIAAALMLSSAVAGPGATYRQDIYKLTVTSPNADSGGPTTEWVSLNNGTWRAELEDQTFIANPDGYVVIDHPSGSVYRRTGPPSFMGDLGSAPDGVLALKAHLKGDTTLKQRGLHLRVGQDQAGHLKLDVLDTSDKLALEVTVEGRVSDEEAAAAQLLDTNPAQVHVTDRALAVGQAPASAITGYWLGPSVANWHAAAAAQHSRTRTPEQIAAGMNARGESQVIVTLYERPGVKVTGVQPGVLTRPDGELQVVSESVTSAHAQGLIDAFDGKNGDETYAAWPRSTVTLANGEQATVVPSQFDGDGQVRDAFFVITNSTLVQITGDVALSDIPALAARLRPLK